MIEIFRSDKCKSMDKEAIEKYGIPSIVLMENAARGVFNDIQNKGDSFLVLCGKGNNGGDGLAIARHLAIEGKDIKVFIISKDDKYSNDFKTNYDILSRIIAEDKIHHIKCEKDIDEQFLNDLNNYDVIVDGIFGVGLNRKLDLWIQEVINKVNEYSKFIVSIDVPTGLDCNMGIEMGKAIEADITYSFEVIKKGFLNYNAFKYVGDVKVITIGIPKEAKSKNSDNVYMLNESEYKKLIPIRELYGHKGDYGRALIVAGSRGFSGAAFIATECTVRSGAGLVTLACKEEIQDILSEKLIEAMTISCNDSKLESLAAKSNAIAFGPGFGTGKYEEDILIKIIDSSVCPLVIDADGITILSKNRSLLDKLRGRAVITPHPGEMARLLDVKVSEIESDRINIAKGFAGKYGIVVLLKGYNTIITDGKNTYINPTGNSKMASGGMGDALTGIINAFISQKLSILNSALLGAYLHGYAADKLSKEMYILNARDIIKNIPESINEICLK